MFGEQRVAEVLASVASATVTPDLLVEAITAAVDAFSADAPDNSDDRATLVITAT
jgi:hypothetical protein